MGFRAVFTQHLHDVLPYAVASSEHHRHLATEGSGRNFRHGGFGVLQLEELVHHVGVLAVGELHVALLAPHHEHRHFGHIAQHHAAVVGGGEGGVAEGPVIGFGYHFAAERLRCLSATEARACGYLAYIVVVHLDDGVCRGYGYIYGLVVVQCVYHVVDDALTHERAHGIVEDEVHILLGVSLYRRERRVVAFLSAFEYLLHLAPLVAQHDILEVAYEHGVRHDGYLVDAAVALKHFDGVFHHHLACHLVELLRCCHAEA